MKITVQRRINAPRDEVFKLFTDFERAPDRVSGIIRVEPLTDRPVGEGYRFRETRMMFKKEATEEMEVASFQAPEHYSLACESCGARYVSTFRFTPAGEGATDVTMELEATPMTLFARLMSPLGRLMAGTVRKCVEKDMDDLAKLAEAQPTDG